MGLARRRAIGALVGAAAVLVGVSARAEVSGLEGALWIGEGEVVGSVNPSGRDQVLRSALVGLSASVRLDKLLIGASADVAGEPFGHVETFLTLHAGWSAPLGHGRLSILGEGGRHSYDELGAGFLSESNASGAALLFVGTRVAADVSTMVGGQGALFGIWLAVRQDLGTVMVRDAGAFTGPGEAYWRVGGTSILGGVRLGFDLDPRGLRAAP